MLEICLKCVYIYYFLKDKNSANSAVKVTINNRAGFTFTSKSNFNIMLLLQFIAKIGL